MSNFNRKIKYLIVFALSVFCVISTSYSQNSFIGVFSKLTGPAKYQPSTVENIYKTKEKGFLYCYIGNTEWDENIHQYINVIKYDSIYTPLWHKTYMTAGGGLTRSQILEDSLGSIFLIYHQIDSLLYKIGIC